MPKVIKEVMNELDERIQTLDQQINTLIKEAHGSTTTPKELQFIICSMEAELKTYQEQLKYFQQQYH